MRIGYGRMGRESRYLQKRTGYFIQSFFIFTYLGLRHTDFLNLGLIFIKLALYNSLKLFDNVFRK